jgi:hypothetical protein
MAGTILGKDQITKVNVAYRAIYTHVRNLIENAKDSVELMHVHFMVDHIDTPELSAIFRDLPFISPDERRALVRMAIYDTVTKKDVAVVEAPKTDQAGVVLKTEPVAAAVYNPPTFKLNVATTGDHKVV